MVFAPSVHVPSLFFLIFAFFVFAFVRYTRYFRKNYWEYYRKFFRTFGPFYGAMGIFNHFQSIIEMFNNPFPKDKKYNLNLTLLKISHILLLSFFVYAFIAEPEFLGGRTTFLIIVSIFLLITVPAFLYDRKKRLSKLKK